MEDALWGVELFQRYVEWLPSFLPVVVGGALFAALIVGLRDRVGRVGRWALVLLAVGIGSAVAWHRLALFDDAYISLRYAKNLLQGHGFVFNAGEPVLGITNFLWTLVIAAASGLSGVRLEYVALVQAFLGYLLFVAGVEKVSRRKGTGGVPLATMACAMSYLVASYASTGLESLTVAAVVVWALDALMGRRWMLAGGLLTLACWMRLDQGLFLALGALVVLRHGGIQGLVRFLVPTPTLLLLLGYCFWAYGDPLPNTVAAKAGKPYPTMGSLYLWSFLLTTHLLWLLPVSFWGMFQVEEDEDRRFRDFAVSGALLWMAYVVYVGGDFMLGRFLLPTVPFLWLGAERAVGAVEKAPKLVLAAAVGATFYGMPILKFGHVEWWLADESTVYEITSVDPLVVEHHNFHTGRFMYKHLTSRGVKPKLAAHGIGMMSFYSELPVIDMLGLTDPVTARKPLPGPRRRPGHERKATDAHLIAEGAVLSSHAHFPGYEDITDLGTPKRAGMKRWHILQYDKEVLNAMRKATRRITFVDIDAWIDETLASDLDRSELKSRLNFLQRYYFQVEGADLERRQKLVDKIDAKLAYEGPEPDANGMVVHQEGVETGHLMVVRHDRPVVKLLAPDGEELRTWRRRFQRAFPGDADAERGGAKHFGTAEPLDDGGLVVVYDGLGLVRLGPKGAILWAKKLEAHGDVWLHDGTIWVFGRGIGEAYGRLVVDDYLWQFDLDGNKLDEISLLGALEAFDAEAIQAFQDTPQRDMNLEGDRRSGYMGHFTDMTVAPEGDAPFAGTWLLTSRNLGRVFAFDLESRSFRWASEVFDRPHATALQDDELLVFEAADLGQLKRTSGDGAAFAPSPGPSPTGGDVQVTEAGVLITYGDLGRARFHTPDGTLVWEWVNPHRGPRGRPLPVASVRFVDAALAARLAGGSAGR